MINKSMENVKGNEKRKKARTWKRSKRKRMGNPRILLNEIEQSAQQEPLACFTGRDADKQFFKW